MSAHCPKVNHCRELLLHIYIHIWYTRKNFIFPTPFVLGLFSISLDINVKVKFMSVVEIPKGQYLKGARREWITGSPCGYKTTQKKTEQTR